MKEPAAQSDSVREILEAAGIQPSAHRLAIAKYVLFTEDHPSADDVLAEMKRQSEAGQGPSMISRATVYNTLNLFAEKGLLKQLAISEGRVVFDPRMDTHHHFVDTDTGEIYDLPASRVPLGPLTGFEEFHVNEVQVVVRGTRRVDTQ